MLPLVRLDADNPHGDGFGVYVHFPWCLRKCPYCDFLSVAREPSTLPHFPYALAVAEELKRRRDRLGSRRPTTVFFGGGTPSLWEPAALGLVLRSILSAPGWSPDEVSVECNPTSLTYDRARALRDQGVNRLSIGVQSLDTDRLEFLGRWHSPADALGAVRDALRAGISRVSADLIFGVRGQSPESAAREAKTLAAEGITHLSAYALTIEAGSQVGQLKRQGKLPLMRDDAVAECYLAVEAAASDAGFDHYEISNYARDGHSAAHNLGYWRGSDYLGLGVGAWGTVSGASGRVRYRNTVVPEAYLEPGVWEHADLDRAGREHLVREWEPITSQMALSERIMLGLRLAEGIDVEAHAACLGVEAWPEHRSRARDKWSERRDLIVSDACMRLAPHAWLRADGIISELM